MKKIVSIAVLAALTATVADAAPSYIARNAKGGYDVTYNYTDKAKTGWYVGARAELSLLNWENKYSSNFPDIPPADSEDFMFESVFGGNAFVGYTFNHFWRAEVEGGVLGQFEDRDHMSDFTMTVPYLMANGYYDFANGLYVGAGLGVAMPTTELDIRDAFDGSDRKETSISPMAGIMLGYSHALDYNLTLDVRYRLSGFLGSEHKLDNDVLGGTYWFQNKIDWVLDNSISIGLRYNF